ncbi:MAG: hypothetical protein M3506_10970, partial [Chloroflexota bacterium]|nr:hypothetical protein [Chloroflexota bacterium]
STTASVPQAQPVRSTDAASAGRTTTPAEPRAQRPEARPAQRGVERTSARPGAYDSPPPVRVPVEANATNGSNGSRESQPESAPAEQHNGPLTLERVEQLWPRLLNSTLLNRSVQALLKGCRPISLNANNVVLDFQYEFHKTKIEEPTTTAAVEQALGKVLGQAATIRCTFGEGQTAAPVRAASVGEQVLADPLVKATTSIFNGKIIEINGGEAES